ncbi:MAG: hypothetical protein HC916_08040 [Coleofasciculaceae cyanobacterium SM2_1_6]|nr:hypothetical protein [Coleofasciculaceae cyanobacterium SM2_1_6]
MKRGWGAEWLQNTAPQLIEIMAGDFYLMSSDAPFSIFSISVMSRHLLYPVGNLATPEAGIYIYSPEGIILQKLSWFQLIPDGSQKPWRDVSGGLKLQGERLDRAYLNQWARRSSTSRLTHHSPATIRARKVEFYT